MAAGALVGHELVHEVAAALTKMHACFHLVGVQGRLVAVVLARTSKDWVGLAHDHGAVQAQLGPHAQAQAQAQVHQVRAPQHAALLAVVGVDKVGSVGVAAVQAYLVLLQACYPVGSDLPTGGRAQVGVGVGREVVADLIFSAARLGP